MSIYTDNGGQIVVLPRDGSEFSFGSHLQVKDWKTEDGILKSGVAVYDDCTVKFVILENDDKRGGVLEVQFIDTPNSCEMGKWKTGSFDYYAYDGRTYANTAIVNRIYVFLSRKRRWMNLNDSPMYMEVDK